MGSKKYCFSVFLKTLVMFYMAVSVKGEKKNFKAESVDSFIRDYTFKKMVHPRTGTMYNISLPSNFSGIDVSVVRLRSGSFWRRGVNHSFFRIPPKVLPWPYVTRFDIVYQNLGNWSSSYYDVPNHTFAAPVVSFSAYYSNSTETENVKIFLTVTGDPFQILFPVLELPENKNATLKCVRFGNDGEIEFTNITSRNTCLYKSQGHFSVVVPSQERKKKKTRRWKWWVIGFAIGVASLLLLFLIIVVVYKLVKAITIAKMERNSENSETLSSHWIGGSRLPSGPAIRTEPVLEHTYTHVP